MENFVQWFLANWQLVGSALYLILALVLLITKKKPIKVVDSVYHELFILVPVLIKEAEDKYPISGSGSSKLAYVLNGCTQFLKEKYPNIDPDGYVDFIKGIVELILSTPVKKVQKGFVYGKKKIFTKARE